MYKNYQRQPQLFKVGGWKVREGASRYEGQASKVVSNAYGLG